MCPIRNGHSDHQFNPQRIVSVPTKSTLGTVYGKPWPVTIRSNAHRANNLGPRAHAK
jgi:hypothetical protein